METWEFLPYKAVGPICFDDTKSVVDKKIGESKRAVVCKNEEIISRDYNCISIDYDIDTQMVEAIGVFPTAYDLEITYNDINITQIYYKATLSQLIALHYDVYFNFDFFFVKKIGIGFYISDNALCDITFYSKNYADSWWLENKGDYKIIALSDLC